MIRFRKSSYPQVWNLRVANRTVSLLLHYRKPLSSAIWLVTLLLGALLLNACAVAEVSPTSPTEEAVSTEEAVPSKEEESTDLVEDKIEAEPSAVTCEVIPIPNNPLIAQVSDTDWIKGPVDAPITLIEYGDFQ